jgi:SagB-type dehydrogenase family enzyme
VSTKLPPPVLDGTLSVETAISQRRSQRHFSGQPLTLVQVGQILWAAQGVSGRVERRRTVPSAGALDPLVAFLAVREEGVEGLAAGVYCYEPGSHELRGMADGDVSEAAVEAALGQDFLGTAPVCILIAADCARTAERYAGRAERYVHMEAGHAGQNVSLQAEALGLGTVMVGAFDDERMAAAFCLPNVLRPLYVMPVGYVR